MSKAPEPMKDLDWDADRAKSLGENALALWLELLQKLPSMPVCHDLTSPQVREKVTFPVPDEPLKEEALMDHLRKVVLECSMFPGHPGFFGYISGTGTVPGVVADMLASAINQNAGGWRLGPAAIEIELNLTKWFAREFGMPDTAGGMFLSGGSMANFTAMKLARDQSSGEDDIRSVGLRNKPELVFYASAEVHGVLYRAADMLGMGQAAVRIVPTDARDRMQVDELVKMIDADIAAGKRPIAVVGTAGSVETGAIDPLEELADVAKRYELWFHVDAAYGGSAAMLGEGLRPLFRGIERADSIAFDPHKWLYTSLSGGCLLVRDMNVLTSSFTFDANYVYQDVERTGRGIDFIMMGPQFSREFMAFKVWVSLIAYGKKAYARRIAHDVELARYLGARVEEHSDFELVAPVSLSNCCFRYVPADLPEGEGREEYLNTLNERIMTDVQMDGRVYCSNAVRGGKFALRVCIVNFRTEAEHMDLLVDVATDLGKRLDAELRPASLRGSNG